MYTGKAFAASNFRFEVGSLEDARVYDALTMTQTADNGYKRWDAVVSAWAFMYVFSEKKEEYANREYARFMGQTALAKLYDMLEPRGFALLESPAGCLPKHAPGQGGGGGAVSPESMNANGPTVQPCRSNLNGKLGHISFHHCYALWANGHFRAVPAVA